MRAIEGKCVFDCLNCKYRLNGEVDHSVCFSVHVIARINHLEKRLEEAQRPNKEEVYANAYVSIETKSEESSLRDIHDPKKEGLISESSENVEKAEGE